MYYIYDTHIHTSQASRCARSSGKEIARAYHKAGYAGIIITDHFLNGWTCVPKDIPWEEQISIFVSGYEEAREEGEKYGLDVFFGWEYCDNGTEFLTYGLDYQWLLRNPNVLSWNTLEYLKRVRSGGGFISHAHPFRKRNDIPPVYLYPKYVDSVEIFNGGNGNDKYNEEALKYANFHQLLHTSGSDSHGAEKLNSGGMAFPRRLTSIQDFISSVKSERGNLFCMGQENRRFPSQTL